MSRTRDIQFDGAALTYEGRKLVWTTPRSRWGRLLVNCRNAIAEVMASRNVAYLELARTAIDIDQPFAVYRLEDTGTITLKGGLETCVCEVIYADKDTDSRMLFAEKLHQQAKTKVLSGNDTLLNIGEGLVPILTLRVQVRI